MPAATPASAADICAIAGLHRCFNAPFVMCGCPSSFCERVRQGVSATKPSNPFLHSEDCGSHDGEERTGGARA